MPPLNEADTCRVHVTPKLRAAGWNDDQITEQKTFTNGRIVVGSGKPRRREPKRADYVLHYQPDFTIAVVEAKAEDKNPGDGFQQAKDYAAILGLKFAYSTNGHGIVEHDFLTGKDTDRESFPSPDDLWARPLLILPSNSGSRILFFRTDREQPQCLILIRSEALCRTSRLTIRLPLETWRHRFRSGSFARQRKRGR